MYLHEPTTRNAPTTFDTQTVCSNTIVDQTIQTQDSLWFSLSYSGWVSYNGLLFSLKKVERSENIDLYPSQSIYIRAFKSFP